MKQTAVEWLIEQLENHNGVTRTAFENVIQQAKEMEKEQIIDAFDDGAEEWCDGFYKVDISSENYYNKTFKSE